MGDLLGAGAGGAGGGSAASPTGGLADLLHANAGKNGSYEEVMKGAGALGGLADIMGAALAPGTQGGKEGKGPGLMPRTKEKKQTRLKPKGKKT